MEKKKWQKPELTILVRSMPEELVLLSCKGLGPVYSPADESGVCYQACDTCQDIIST
jgi:hypothetical protein